MPTEFNGFTRMILHDLKHVSIVLNKAHEAMLNGRQVEAESNIRVAINIIDSAILRELKTEREHDK